MGVKELLTPLLNFAALLVHKNMRSYTYTGQPQTSHLMTVTIMAVLLYYVEKTIPTQDVFITDVYDLFELTDEQNLGDFLIAQLYEELFYDVEESLYDSKAVQEILTQDTHFPYTREALCILLQEIDSLWRLKETLVLSYRHIAEYIMKKNQLQTSCVYYYDPENGRLGWERVNQS